MSVFMDPYQVLGVSRDASDDEIKKAYRNLSRKYHPDANINNPNKAQAEEMFKKVQAAYDQIMKERQYGGHANSRQASMDRAVPTAAVIRVATEILRTEAAPIGNGSGYGDGSVDYGGFRWLRWFWRRRIF